MNWQIQLALSIGLVCGFMGGLVMAFTHELAEWIHNRSLRRRVERTCSLVENACEISLTNSPKLVDGQGKEVKVSWDTEVSAPKGFTVASKSVQGNV